MSKLVMGLILGFLMAFAVQVGAWSEEVATKRALMALESRMSAVEADIAVICLRTYSSC